ncbi:hypothetical protein NDU88_003598 [Pleurodeles waltl]|uniref:Uncharacterized protein n=1 Tax=Pleurodeles waltl TaxID=8319 RepID=A0AAV7TRQ2_PLEWA|nr:hypothetical protein NDU88_003598 [Pleurodeles waltl]
MSSGTLLALQPHRQPRWMTFRRSKSINNAALTTGLVGAALRTAARCHPHSTTLSSGLIRIWLVGRRSWHVGRRLSSLTASGSPVVPVTVGLQRQAGPQAMYNHDGTYPPERQARPAATQDSGAHCAMN